MRDHQIEHGLEREEQTEPWCWWGRAERRKFEERQKNIAYLGKFGKVSFIVFYSPLRQMQSLITKGHHFMWPFVQTLH